MELKKCSRCQRDLPKNPDYFVRRKNTKDGLEYHCKECNRKRYRNHYEEHKDYHQKRREDNRERLRELNRIRYYNNKQYFRDKEKRLRIEKPEKAKVRDAIKRHNRKTRFEELEVNFSDKQWIECVNYFDNCCAYCGNADKLTQEHFIPLVKGGEYTINNIIPVCQTCNSSKNDKDFFEWYPDRDYYSKDREEKILKYLGYENQIQQLALL